MLLHKTEMPEAPRLTARNMYKTLFIPCAAQQQWIPACPLLAECIVLCATSTFMASLYKYLTIGCLQ